jgi:Histone methylation protein DOT1
LTAPSTGFSSGPCASPRRGLVASTHGRIAFRVALRRGSREVGRVKGLVERSLRPVYLPLRERVARSIYVPGAALETEGEIRMEELGLARPDRVRYKPTGWSILPRILPAREVSDDDVFIDYGSGMGRIVYEAAARYSFERVIGLELSDRLNHIARSNLDRNSNRLRCANIQLITQDAVVYEPPPDITVAFFYNPFTGGVFDTVVHRLLAVAERRLRIIYHNPVEHELLMRSGRVTVQRRLRGWRPGNDWSRSNMTVMYECMPVHGHSGTDQGVSPATAAHKIQSKTKELSYFPRKK